MIMTVMKNIGMDIHKSMVELSCDKMYTQGVQYL